MGARQVAELLDCVGLAWLSDRFPHPLGSGTDVFVDGFLTIALLVLLKRSQKVRLYSYLLAEQQLSYLLRSWRTTPAC